jgi:hypothetical protein
MNEIRSMRHEHSVTASNGRARARLDRGVCESKARAEPQQGNRQAMSGVAGIPLTLARGWLDADCAHHAAVLMFQEMAVVDEGSDHVGIAEVHA